MCKISIDTIRRANDSMSRRRSSVHCAKSTRKLGDDIVVSTTYKGREYSQRITQDEIRASFGRALKIVRGQNG